MTSIQEDLVSASEFLSTLDPLDLDNDMETNRSSPRSGYSAASSSEVFPTGRQKLPSSGRRPLSARAPVPPLSSIPLPVKTSGPIKIPALLKNARSISKTGSISSCRSSPVANKHTLEIQFLNKNKRYLQMKRDLLEKQKPVIDLYQNLVQIKKRLEELGKMVPLDDLKLVPYSDAKKPLFTEGAGEQAPSEMISSMRNSIEEIPKTLMDVCRNLLNRRALIVELLENVLKSEVHITEDKLESLKNEGLQLQRSLEGIIAEYQGKITELVSNWQTLINAKNTNAKAEELELKVKEQDRLVQDSNRIIGELKRKLEDKRTSYDKSMAELNGIIQTLRDQIRKLEQDLENERKATVDFKSRNSTNAQNLKSMRVKIADLENDKKNTDTENAKLQKKVRLLQDQLKQRETEWAKEKEDLSRTLKRQSSALNQVTNDKTHFESTLEAIEQEKQDTETELRQNIVRLTEDLETTRRELEELKREKDEAVQKCAAFEGYMARMGIECKETMERVSSSIQWGKSQHVPATTEADQYIDSIAKDLRIKELEEMVRKLERDRLYQIEEKKQLEEQRNAVPTETEKQLSKQQECITKYQMLLEDSENKLREKSAEVANLCSEICQLKVRQEALEEQNYNCPTDELQRMVEEGRHKLNELMRKSMESEQKLEHYANIIEKQTQQMSEMENLLRYRENMAGVLKASRDELLQEKDSLTKYSQEMRTVLAEVTKEGKMKDRLIKELQEKIDLRERQINKLEKEVRELEANLMVTNEKRFKLQEAIGSMEKELQSTKAHVNQLADINSRNVKPKFLKPF